MACTPPAPFSVDSIINCEKINNPRLVAYLQWLETQVCEGEGDCCNSVTFAQTEAETPPNTGNEVVGDLFYNVLVCPAVKLQYYSIDGVLPPAWNAIPSDSSDIFQNTRYVSTNGDDSNALVGSETCKFLTVEAAENADPANEGFVEAHGDFVEDNLGTNNLTEVKGNIDLGNFQENSPINYTLRAKEFNFNARTDSILIDDNTHVTVDADKARFDIDPLGTASVIPIQLNGPNGNQKIHLHFKDVITDALNQFYIRARFGNEVYFEFDKHLSSPTLGNRNAIQVRESQSKLFIRGKYAEFYQNFDDRDYMQAINGGYMDAQINSMYVYYGEDCDTPSIFWQTSAEILVHDSNIYVDDQGNNRASLISFGGTQGRVTYRDCNITYNLNGVPRNHILTRLINGQSQAVFENCTINLIGIGDNVGGGNGNGTVVFNNISSNLARPKLILRNTSIVADAASLPNIRGIFGSTGNNNGRCQMIDVYSNIPAIDVPVNSNSVDDFALAHFNLEPLLAPTNFSITP